MNEARKTVTVHELLKKKERGERIVVLTCYDALFARLLDAAGVDTLLVGDSVNQVLAGAPTTLSATLDQMIYHTTIVRRGAEVAASRLRAATTSLWSPIRLPPSPARSPAQ